MGMTPVYVCVHVPEFAAQALLRLRPELRGCAVAVMAGDAPLEEVCSVNRQAARLGIARGMTRAELESFPGACVLRRSEMEERCARAAVLEAAAAFTPRMEVPPARAAALDVVLDMTGSQRIFGPAETAVARIAEALRRLRFSVRLAASANVQAALCLAPVCAKPRHIAQGNEAAALHKLPLRTLALTAQQAETMELWGIRTLGELAGLPEDDLVVRLGEPGRLLRLLARGEHPHLMVPQEPTLALREYIAFDAPVEMLDSLLFVLGPMLDQLLARAQNHALALSSVTVTLGLDGGGEHVRTVKPALPVAQRDVLLKLLHLDLQAHSPPAGVLTVAITAEPGDRSKVQMGLFAPQTPEPMRLDVTLARIAALVGEDRVGRARLKDTHEPDGFVMERFTVPDAPAAEAEAQTVVALRRCRPPVRLAMRSVESRPAGFFFGGKSFVVQKAFGPWRKSGEWWTAGAWAREEWDVCAAAGSETLLCVLVHDRVRQYWQMEATYD